MAKASLLVALLSVGAWAQAEPTPLSPGLSAERLGAALRYRLDVGEAPSEVLAAFRRGDGVISVGAAAADARSPYQPIWVHLPLENVGAVEDGAPPTDSWVLVADTYGLLSVEAYVVRADGAIASVLSYAYDEPFDSAEISFARLRSEAVRLARGERVDLLARVRLGPVRRVALRLLTEADMRDQAFADGLGLTAFYAFTFSMLLFFAGFHLSLENPIGLAYAGLFAVALLFIAYVDGFAFRFVYPNAPHWHFPFGVLLLNALSSFGFLAAGRSLRSGAGAGAGDPARDRPARLFERLALAPAAAAASAAVVAQETAALLSYLCAVAMFGAHLYAVGRWSAPAAGGVAAPPALMALNRTAAGLTAAVAAGFVVIALLGWRDGPSPPLALKILFAVVGVISMTALTISLVDLRRRHRRAVADRMDALAAEATEARRRLAAERAYAEVRSVAERRARRLAEASHDIRQPLASLRLRMSAAAERLPAPDRDGLRQALDHLDALSQHYLEEGRPAAAPDVADAPAIAAATTESYPLAIILRGVRDMFEDEARAKGVALRCVESGVETRAPALALMRIVSNLVSNAVKHAHSGKIVVGVRRRGGAGEIWVVDQGPGMTAEDLDRALRPYGKGAASVGEGLGLAICRSLAEQIGIELSVASEPGRGTVFRLALGAQYRSTV